MTPNDFLFLQDALVGKANILLKEIMTLVKTDDTPAQATQSQEKEQNEKE